MKIKNTYLSVSSQHMFSIPESENTFSLLKDKKTKILRDRVVDDTISDRIDKLENMNNNLMNTIDKISGELTDVIGNYGNINSEKEENLKVKIDDSLEYDIKQVENTRRTRRTLGPKGSMSEKTANSIIATIEALRREQDIKTEKYNRLVDSSKEVDEKELNEYVSGLTRNNEKILALKSQLRANGAKMSNERGGLAGEMVKSGKQIGESPFGTLTKRIFGGVEYQRPLTNVNKRNIKKYISEMKEFVEKNDEKLKEGYPAMLKVNTNLAEGYVIVNSSGYLNDKGFESSFSLNRNALDSIFFEFMRNVRLMSKNEKKKFAGKYGRSDIKDIDIWNSFLVYILSYLSLVYYSINAEDDKFDLDIPLVEGKNILNMLKCDIINRLSNVSIPIVSSQMDQDSKRILDHAIGGKIVYFMYKNSNYTSVVGNSSGLIMSKTLNKIIS